MVRKVIVISQEHEQWLLAHKELNLSGLVQKMLDEKMRKE